MYILFSNFEKYEEKKLFDIICQWYIFAGKCNVHLKGNVVTLAFFKHINSILNNNIPNFQSLKTLLIKF